MKQILLKPPFESGYNQSRWDGPLVGQYLRDVHHIDLRKSQINNWLHQIGFTLQRGRKKFIKADEEERKVFIAEIKKNL